MDVNPTELNTRESQLLSLLVRGHNAHAIANELHISEAYVYYIMRELRQRFLVLSTPALVSRAIGEGIIRPDGTISSDKARHLGPQNPNEQLTETVIIVFILPSDEQKAET